jgi:2-polyprenyl-3-methyl-5-hydroxy-6-metoxy-1,4-benzoquinol methylase
MIAMARVGDEARPRAVADEPRPELLRYVPARAHTLLDVGCGRGELGARVKAERGATVWGIEIDPVAAGVARARLDRLLDEDVMTALDKLPRGFFDCVVLGDVLEQLVDPFAVVAVLKPLLSDDGVVIASLTNVRHFAVAWELLWRARFRHAEGSARDRTRLRFFTRRTVVELFATRGYEVTVHGIDGAQTTTQQLIYRLLPSRFRDMQWMRFAVVARPKVRR